MSSIEIIFSSVPISLVVLSNSLGYIIMDRVGILVSHLPLVFTVKILTLALRYINYPFILFTNFLMLDCPCISRINITLPCCIFLMWYWNLFSEILNIRINFQN